MQKSIISEATKVVNATKTINAFTSADKARGITKEEFSKAIDTMLQRLPQLAKQEKVAVAFSGGSDSLALLKCAAEYYTPQRVVAISIDHAISGEIEGEVASLLPPGVELVGRRVDWGREIREHQPATNKFEMLARDLRYKLMGEECEKRGINLLLVGHHRDDDLATMFYRAGRGSGIDGLAGMRMISPLPVISPHAGRLDSRNRAVGVFLGRPLLNFSKERLIATLGELTPIHDSFNDRSEFLRNGINQTLAKVTQEIPKEDLEHFLESMKLLRNHSINQVKSLMRKSVILDRQNASATIILNSPDLLTRPSFKPLFIRSINLLLQYSAALPKPVKSVRLTELYHNMQRSYNKFVREDARRRARLPIDFESTPIDQTKRIDTSAYALGGGLISPLSRTDTVRRVAVHNKTASPPLEYGPGFMVQSERLSRNEQTFSAEFTPASFVLYDKRIFLRPLKPVDSRMDWRIEPLTVDSVKKYRGRLNMTGLLMDTPMTCLFNLPLVIGEMDGVVEYAALPTINSQWSRDGRTVQWQVIHAGESIITSKLFY